MADERCVHDMLPGMCAICLGHKLPEHDDGMNSSREWDEPLVGTAAKYGGFCRRCENIIEVGEDIVVDSQLRNRWIHRSCSY